MTDPIAKSDGELSRKPTGKSSWVIRATREEDCEGITELVNMPGFRHGTLRMPFQSVEQTRKWIRSDDPDKLNIVAVADGKVVGQAGLHRFSGRRAHAAGIGMGVHDAWQRQGVGTTLLAALVDAADNWMGLKRISN